MKREPTKEEEEMIASAITSGDRVEATSLYISITERGLTEAQEHIRKLTEELKAADPEKFLRKKPKKMIGNILRGYLD